MNKFSAGTLVMIKAPNESLTAPLYTGMIGEVKDSQIINNEIPINHVAVDFPSTRSKGWTGWWIFDTAYLVPISDPDMDVGDVEADGEYLKKREKEAV
jgi:hypothetical protein